MEKITTFLSKLNLKNIKITLKIYGLVLIFFTAFRFILFFTSLDKLGTSYDIGTIFSSFFMGIRFDIVITSYLLFFPCLLLTINLFFNRFHRTLSSILFYVVFLLFTLTFMVCAADIPYFHQFFSRFSVSAFEWADSPLFIFKMVLEEPTYWLYILPFLLFIFLFYIGLKKILKGKLQNTKSPLIFPEILTSLFFLFFIFLGMRGRTAIKSPIRVGTAFFSNNAMLNKLGLNPNFTLMRSYLDQKKLDNQAIHLMNTTLAIQNVQNQFNIKNPSKNNPILRKIVPDTILSKKPNIVLIIMESMSVGKMQRGGNTESLTPFLDSLSHQGFYFTQTYSAGIHTFNGIFSTLYSFPALFRQHSMKHTPIANYSGIAAALKKLDYTTTFFIPHDGQFDNVEGFLMANDFNRVYSRKDYPSEEIKTTLGVPDDFMFRFSIPIINQLNQNTKPFFVTFMTASDHGPWYIPPYFKPKSKDKKKQAIEYADYALNKFLSLAQKQAWFDNTLFVFIADHGAALDATYDISLTYNHVPLLFYGPKFIPQPKNYNKMAGQIDVYPSIMGLLHLPFQNNTLGIDLFHHTRPYIYFGVDDKFGVIDNNWLYIYRKNNRSGLYKYTDKNKENFIEKHPKIGKKMKNYAISNLQTYQYLLKHRLTEIQPN